MITDFRTLAPEAELKAEIVIVGGGAVGLSMAVDLARRGRDVLVVEAGGERLEKASQAYFELATTQGRALAGLHAGRFRALGGTANFWGGQVLAFDPIVFESRPWVADIGWPISASDLEPDYARAFQLLGLSRQIEDAAVWRRLSVDPPATGDDLELFFTRWLPEPNLTRLFGKEITTLPNPRVLVNAPVTALQLGPSGDAISALVVGREGGGERRLKGDCVVLASGTVETARLLMLPTDDGGAAPWSANPWLGRGFCEHVEVDAGEVALLNAKRFHALFDNAFVDGVKYHPKLKLSAQAQRRRRMTGVSAQFTFNSDYGQALADAKLFFRSIIKGQFDGNITKAPGQLWSALRVGTPLAVRYLHDRRMYNPTDRGVTLRLSAEQAPLRPSGLRLGETRDGLGMPVAEMSWSIDEGLVETLAFMARQVGQWLEGEGLAQVRLPPALDALEPSVLREAVDANHQMGMVRMARDPADGVVDPECRVHGMRNLYVAGAAVFPTTGFENPTFTAIALALRTARRLCEEPAR